MSMFYSSLTAALDDIATRSFHEGATVHLALSHCGGTVADETSDNSGIYWCPSCKQFCGDPITEGYAVSGDADPRSGDYLEDYGDGVEWPPNAIDHSREHDPAELYDTAAHVEYNLPAAIAALEAGSPVSFHYYAVSTTCPVDLPDEHEVGLCDECEGYGDTLTGWALVAYAA